MNQKKLPLVNVGLVGGGQYCLEMLKKKFGEDRHITMNTRIVAVADPNAESPGMIYAEHLGLLTFQNYYELYKIEYDIHLIIVLVPEQEILNDVNMTKPPHVRVLSYYGFEFLWKDISDKETEIKARKDEMEAIINNIQDFIVVITPEMEIVEANEAFLQQMGYSRQQVIGQKCHEIFQKENRQCHLDAAVCPLNAVIRNKLPSHRTDLIRRDKNGRLRHMDVIVYPIWEPDGRISKFIEISRDITEIKKEQDKITARLEMMVDERTRELQDTHEKLLHQDKMSSLGKLSAAVVHEINNPIAGILNLIMLIKRINQEGIITEKETEQFSGYLDLMETETVRISRIVSNLLAFSRQSKLELKRINFNKLIEKVIVMNFNLLKISQIDVEKELDSQLPELIGSEDQLFQILMNFVSNAVEAMETSVTKTLKITSQHSLENNEIIIRFIDTGIGVPRNLLLKIFEPFYTTKTKGKGVGLGLSVVYGIIEKHGGNIKVESRVGAGTEIIVRLPIDGSNSKFDG